MCQWHGMHLLCPVRASCLKPHTPAWTAWIALSVTDSPPRIITFTFTTKCFGLLCVEMFGPVCTRGHCCHDRLAVPRDFVLLGWAAAGCQACFLCRTVRLLLL